ncbi:peroxiredoxin family protein [Aureliella helgolandensis]|uniref:AhpC/TSA family protein n=1 Tax=Aureliella helgolandensis TaxID=2527968 RepID=A0A518G7W5_9BACT|nr:peroxiredoxin family protein [Aureliella helgolandensis]QDV24675.1 AhpC/TSA family protein [Aureliella helgolandensis]
MVKLWIALSLGLCLIANGLVVSAADKGSAEKPSVGKPVVDFELAAVAGTLEGEVRLTETLKHGPVLLVVLRGYPEYQCPACTRQVGALIGQAKTFADHNVNVLLVYPGAEKDLDKHADEFLHGTKLPAPFTFLLDPGYKFTNAYGLRWDAPKETAYPSTFLIDTDRTVKYAKISSTHGDRAEVKQLIAAIKELK